VKLPDFPKPPVSLDPSVTYGEKLIETGNGSLEHMRKVAAAHFARNWERRCAAPS
jgi:hypothetical protein